jgi:hypothetical protein
VSDGLYNIINDVYAQWDGNHQTYKAALDFLPLNEIILTGTRSSVFIISNNALRKHRPDTTVCLGVY